MSNSKLFAFHMARPLSSHNEIENADYDPQTQTTVWQGQTRAQANFYCSWQFYGVDCRVEFDGGSCYQGDNLYWFGSQCDN